MSHVFNSPDFAHKTDARRTTQRADRLGQRLVPREGQSIQSSAVEMLAPSSEVLFFSDLS